jgi:hypothetical protein
MADSKVAQSVYNNKSGIIDSMGRGEDFGTTYLNNLQKMVNAIYDDAEKNSDKALEKITR